MIRGLDCSHWQGTINWSLVKNDNIKFAFAKCTQGNSFKDAKYYNNKISCQANDILFGSYHFANGGDPIQEADFYVANIGALKKGELMCLDWEISHSNPVDWCKKFLDRVYSRSGVRPFLYTNEARVKSLNWKPVVDGNYGLWVAKYGINNGQMNTKPDTGAWDFYAIWQYTSKGSVKGITGNVDLDTYNGSLDSLKKYGVVTINEQSMGRKIAYPIDKVYITQNFGENPAIYKQFGLKGHNGMDFRTKFWDSPLGRRYVMASLSGVVIEIGNQGGAGYGIFIRLKHDGNEQTVYGHLYKTYVKVNQYVNKGQTIGLTDNTGFSTGAHLHLGYREKGWENKINNGYNGYSEPSFE